MREILLAGDTNRLVAELTFAPRQGDRQASRPGRSAQLGLGCMSRRVTGGELSKNNENLIVDIDK